MHGAVDLRSARRGTPSATTASCSRSTSSGLATLSSRWAGSQHARVLADSKDVSDAPGLRGQARELCAPLRTRLQRAAPSSERLIVCESSKLAAHNVAPMSLQCWRSRPRPECPQNSEPRCGDEQLPGAGLRTRAVACTDGQVGCQRSEGCGLRGCRHGGDDGLRASLGSSAQRLRVGGVHL